MKKKNTGKQIISFLITLIIILYFLLFVDLKPIISNISKLDLSSFLIAVVIFFPNTFLIIYKWYLIVRKFYRESFVTTYKKLSKAILLSELLQSTFFLDLAKLYFLKSLKKSQRILLLANEKIINLIFKFIYFIPLLVIFFLIPESKTSILNMLSQLNLSTFVVLLLFTSIILYSLIKRKKQLVKYYNTYLSNKSIDVQKLFVVETLRNFLLSAIYFISVFQIYDTKTALMFAFFAPIIELLLRFQFFSSLGFRELIFYSIGGFIGLDSTLVLTSIFISLVMTFTIINNYFVSVFILKK